MIILDLQTVLFVLLLLVLALFGGVYALTRRRAGHATAPLPDAWRALDQLPLGVVVVEHGGLVWASQAARALLPDGPGALGALGLLDGHAASSGQITQPLPLRWWRMPLDESRTLLLLLDEREAQRATRAQQAFVGQLAHELRTPLTALLAHIAIARDQQTPTATAQASLATMQRESERLARLVRDLLELQRLEVADAPLLQPTNVVLVAEKALAALLLPAEQRGIELALEADADLPRVLAAPDRLAQVFVIVLDNAVKYCRSGDQIIARLQNEPDGVRCTVQDSGPGIPAADLPHVMERLYRGRSDVAGSGLGLALAAEILRQHGSALTITSVAAGEQTGTTCAWVVPKAQLSRRDVSRPHSRFDS